MLKQSQPRLSQLASAVAVVLGGITLLPSAHAAAPAAGVSISNIAVANYTDATGAPQRVNSNEVRTTVLQVASFTLIDDRSVTTNPNGQVAMSHTLTNTGNASDSFTIGLTNDAGDDIDLNNIAVYIDANGDGTPDNTTNLVGTAVTVAPGSSVNLIVVGTAPVSATSGQTAELTITATSVFSTTTATTLTETDTDTVTITGNAVVNVIKSANVSAVNVGDTVTYTLAYSNTGNTTATDVVIRDLLPANVTYVAGSARWSNTAPTALTDGDDAASLPGAGDRFSFGVSAPREAQFTIASLPANTNGTLTFQVTVDAAAPAGQIINRGHFVYDPDGPGATPPTTEAPTNDAPVTVNATRLGTINDSTDDAFADGVAPGGGATAVAGDTVVDDVQTKTITQGSTATFPVIVHNTGNVSQIYEVTVNRTGLPAGSSVQVLRNGAPLTNITGTSAVDVGPVAVGATVELTVVITVPATFSDNDGAATTSDTIVTISPVGNAAATDSTTLVIEDVLAATVDLTNGAAGLLYDNNPANDSTADGEGPYVPATIVDDESTTPGVSVSFPVEIFNGGNGPDNFNLTATVPAGWTVVFQDPATGQVVTNSGNIPAGATRDLVAIVTPPNNALVDPTNDVILTVTSPVTSLTDSIKNNVAVTEVRALNLTPDRQGQVSPGGTVTYVHTLTNNGNVTEGDAVGELPVSIGTVGNINSVVTVGVDLNGDGELTANETIQGNDINSVLSGGLAPFTSYTLLVKVEAPSSAQPGQQDISTIAVTPAGVINGVAAPASVQIIDTTTVTAGNVRVVKTQALDALCDGVADGGASSYTTAPISAEPNQCVVYRIVATNQGNLPVTNVVLTDATPAFTTISTVATNTPAVPANISSPAVGETGTVTDNVGNLAPAATAQINFGVRIDQ